MRLALLGDMHLGCRNASIPVADFHIKFFEDTFIPYLVKHNIKTILQAGDIFDTRKFTNHVVLQHWKDRVFTVLEKFGIQFHIVLGNHDLALRNSLVINTPSLFLSGYSNIHIWNSPEEIEFDGTKFLLVPWICSENYDDAVNAMKATKAIYCLGHFEFASFEMHAGQVSEDGMDHSQFKKFDTIFSGHYHTKSHKDNVKYLGIPYQMTWIDYNDPKGFHIFDTRSTNLEFIENTKCMFQKIFYNDNIDGSVIPDYYKSIDLSNLENSYVKVVVVSKKDTFQFDMLLDRLYNMSLADLKIVEDFSDLDSDSIDDDDVELEDTKSLIDSYVDASDIDLDRDKLKTVMRTLYTESLEVMV